MILKQERNYFKCENKINADLTSLLNKNVHLLENLYGPLRLITFHGVNLEIYVNI